MNSSHSTVISCLILIVHYRLSGHLVNMGIFVLMVKAELEGIAKFSLSENSRFLVDLHSQGEEKKGVYICPYEELEVEGGRGTAQFVLSKPFKCNISIIALKDYTRSEYTAGDSGEFVPMAAFECRGCDITNISLPDPFDVESTGGYRWEKQTLDDGEWCEYDEENDVSVMLTNLECMVETHSGKGDAKGKKGKKQKGGR